MKLFKYSIICKSGREFNVITSNMEQAKELVTTRIGNDDIIRTVKCLGRDGVPKGTHDHTRKPHVNRFKSNYYHRVSVYSSTKGGKYLPPERNESGNKDIFHLAAMHRH